MATSSTKPSAPAVKSRSHPAPPMMCTSAATPDTAVTSSKEFHGTKSTESRYLLCLTHAAMMRSAAIVVLNQYGMGETKTGIKTATTTAQIINRLRCLLVDVPCTRTSSSPLEIRAEHQVMMAAAATTRIIAVNAGFQA